MLGFEHPSHMVTHPSTDEAQCCLSLEIFVNSAKKKEDENRIKSPLRIEGTKNLTECCGTGLFSAFMDRKCSVLNWGGFMS